MNDSDKLINKLRIENVDYQDLLIKYPEVYKGYKYGFCIGPGWYFLVDELSAKIREYLKENDLPDFGVVQVKEKYGGLRFYVKGADTILYTLVHDYEGNSYDICERCSMPGSTDGSVSWIRVLCTSCRSKK